jgi:succinyl-CoA synthetase beta subunit
VDLFEYQGKQYFARYDIPVSPGGVATTVDEAVAQADAAGYPVVVKAQVQVGGRGKAGGIKLANDAAEARQHASAILGMDIKGHVVQRVWVEKASDIAEEYYASFTLDRSAKQHLLMLSAQGGVDIEEVAARDPDAIVKLHVDPVDGLSQEASRAAAEQARINPAALDGVAEILVLLYRCFTEGDCDLAEINPLILRPDGGVHALDAKVSLDDNAAFRHEEWKEPEGLEKRDPRLGNRGERREELECGAGDERRPFRREKTHAWNDKTWSDGVVRRGCDDDRRRALAALDERLRNSGAGLPRGGGAQAAQLQEGRLHRFRV